MNGLDDILFHLIPWSVDGGCNQLASPGAPRMRSIDRMQTARCRGKRRIDSFLTFPLSGLALVCRASSRARATHGDPTLRPVGAITPPLEPAQQRSFPGSAPSNELPLQVQEQDSPRARSEYPRRHTATGCRQHGRRGKTKGERAVAACSESPRLVQRTRDCS